MKIEITGIRNSREVIFVNADDDGTVARSGLLDRSEALDLAGELNEVATALTRWALRQGEDERQITLPLGIAA